MLTSNAAYLTPEELERRYIEPFVQEHFPFVPDEVRPQVRVVQGERKLIAATVNRPATRPPHYSYTFTYKEGELVQVIYILASADGQILRVLISR